jgi:uncharacterized protein (DUF433 family)
MSKDNPTATLKGIDFDANDLADAVEAAGVSDAADVDDGVRKGAPCITDTTVTVGSVVLSFDEDPDNYARVFHADEVTVVDQGVLGVSEMELDEDYALAPLTDIEAALAEARLDVDDDATVIVFDDGWSELVLPIDRDFEIAEADGGGVSNEAVVGFDGDSLGETHPNTITDDALDGEWEHDWYFDTLSVADAADALER